MRGKQISIVVNLLLSTGARSFTLNHMQLYKINMVSRAAQAMRVSKESDTFRRLVACSSSNLKSPPAAQQQQYDWQYEILQTYPTAKFFSEMEEQSKPLLPRFLYSISPSEYSSVSQAKKACRFGAIVISREKYAIERQSKEGDDNYYCGDFDADVHINLDAFQMLDSNAADRSIFIASPETCIMEGDIIAVRARIKDSFYPSSCMGYIQPPANTKDIEVVYEDDHISVVNKPELLSTIGDKRQDLQSCLPFILFPPVKKFWPSSRLPPLPRPVHRLDRRTSGLVIVAKTKNALKALSENFRAREVEKSYTAIVFGKPPVTSSEDTKQQEIDTHDWHTIDYPIDGKSSVTLWRSICSVETPTYGTLTLLLCRPKSGRYHQIRRHLSYCLGTPIVGDNKYDKGHKIARNARSLGMFLCSNAIEFKHPFSDTDVSLSSVIKGSSKHFPFDYECSMNNPLNTSQTSVKIRIDTTNPQQKDLVFHVDIPLPLKFKQILGL